MASKSEIVKKYSDPQKVKQLAKKYLGADIQITYSTKDNKKYMIKTPEDKWIHFGQIPYEDYTKHQDEERRRLFRNRNKKWKTSPIWSAGWLSYHLLW